MTTYQQSLMIIFASALIVAVGLLAGLWHRYQQTLKIADDLRVRNAYLEKRDRKNAEASRTLLTNLAPLLEQTDWMTGRWGGQFNTLVALENKRNAAAVAARKALMDSPGLTDFTSQHGYELFKGAVLGGAKGILG